jgi:hypothetical protein
MTANTEFPHIYWPHFTPGLGGDAWEPSTRGGKVQVPASRTEINTRYHEVEVDDPARYSCLLKYVSQIQSLCPQEPEKGKTHSLDDGRRKGTRGVANVRTEVLTHD